MIDGSKVLVTGGTGSFSRAFVAHVLKHCPPARLVIFSRSEHEQEDMAKEFPHPCLRFFIGDVRDQQRLEMAMRDIDLVVHTAALKVVPILEYNPFEAVQTNVIGAQNVIRAAISTGVKKVVALSTDKAVNPTNLYGATKLCAERLFTSAHNLGGMGGPLFSIVRYGNVVGSRGSVVPLFRQLAEKGYALPITDMEMTRFIITMDQAVEFVCNCIERMQGNEIFIPRIPSIKIVDLAKAVWLEDWYPTQACRIEVVGIRPGEKVHEVLLSSDESPKTIQLPDRYIINGAGGGLPKGFAYTSDGNKEWLSVEAFRRML